MSVLRPLPHHSRSFWQVKTSRNFASSKTVDLDSNRGSNNKDTVQRMRQVFHDEGPADAWEHLWREGLTPWDLGGPTPVLLSELRQRRRRQQQRNNLRNHRNKTSTALVPGCGSGHDVVSLARCWDEELAIKNTTDDDTTTIHRTVYGLELSETSLGRAKEVLLSSIRNHGQLSHTDLRLCRGDFFASPSTWQLFHEHRAEQSLTLSSPEPTTIRDTIPSTFDLIFDYTFFCALPPARRGDWGRQMRQLLTKKKENNDGNQIDGGELLTVMFPYVAEPRPDSPGPPYLVSYQDYQGALQEHDGALPRLQLTTPAPYPSKDTVSSRVGQEMVGWWSFET